MKFLLAKWPFWVNALALIFMVMLGGYLFNDVIGFSGVPLKGTCTVSV